MTREWQTRADELAAESIAQGRPYGWFDRLFAEGESGETVMPWDRGPNPLLTSAELPGPGRAVVPGCGLGADAEFLAGRGFDVVAFDVSPTAVRLASERSAGGVQYRVADLFDLPAEWTGAFDLVADLYTVQALPRPLRARVVEVLGSLVAPGGTLLAVQKVLGPGEDPDDGPPWPVTAEELALFGDGRVEQVDGHWRGSFPRPVGGVEQDGARG